MSEAELESQAQVACPKCETLQPTTPSGVASSVIGGEDTIVDDELGSAAIREMLNDIPPQGADSSSWPPVPAGGDDAQHGWAVGGSGEPSAPGSSRVGTLDRFMGPSTHTAPAASVADVVAPDRSSVSEELGWRIKLSSGLVLSFPTIAMVTTWAKEKDADSVEISYGGEDFQPYAVFQTRFQQIRNPVDAFFARKSSTRPGIAAVPPPSVDSEAFAVDDFDAFADEGHLDGSGPGSDEPALDDDYRPNPEAVAAAAALDRPFKSDAPYGQTITFRTGNAVKEGPSALTLTLLLAVVGAGIGVLIWQGVF